MGCSDEREKWGMMGACLTHLRLCLLQLPGDVPAGGLPLEVLQDLHGESLISLA